MGSLQRKEDAAAAVAKTPHRVSLESIKAKVKSCSFINPGDVPHMTIAIMTMENGFTIVGTSKPVDRDNFDLDLGRKFAEENALSQAWLLEGYLLHERLFEGQADNATGT